MFATAGLRLGLLVQVRGLRLEWFRGAVDHRGVLVGIRALDYDLGLAVDGQDGRLSGFLELANQVLRVSLEFAEGVNVCKVEGHTIRFT